MIKNTNVQIDFAETRRDSSELKMHRYHSIDKETQ